MNYFYQFYKWAMNTKLFMAIYFVAGLAIYSVESLMIGMKSVNILMMLQMLIVFFITAAVQKMILPDGSMEGKPLKNRAALWFFISVLITAISAYIFPWFQDFPNWAPILYIVFLTLGYIAMWAGILIIHQLDTKELNEKLNQYQKKDR